MIGQLSFDQMLLRRHLTSPGLDCVTNQVSGASVNLSPRALLLVVAVRLRVCALTRLRSDCFTSHLRHLRTAQVAMSAGEVDPSWLSTFCLTCHTQVWHPDLDLVNMQVRHDGALGRLRAARAPLSFAL